MALRRVSMNTDDNGPTPTFVRKRVSARGSEASVLLLPSPSPHSGTDDAVSGPWPTTGYNLRGEKGRGSLPTGLSVRFSSRIDVSNKRNSFARGESLVEEGEPVALLRDKMRRLLVLQRKKHKELLKAEDDAFNDLKRQAEFSVESINAFLEFRRNMKASNAHENSRLGVWIMESFADSIKQIIREEWETRRSIVSYEWRLREAKRRVEWLTGAKMRFEREMKLLLHAEECRRKFIERSELREAWAIPALCPFVVVFENLGVLGPCPFVSVEDCPFYCRGEGYRNPHYEFSMKGKPQTVMESTAP
ncbi:hypothetical protein MOQ_000035 [Trypanosoma cruzi marinkellei]|uniref:Uncharacterized protein n=1 Tax=Trypanosoma cruzi marinkellei TaxID=85056 RepID=K2NPF8_TRYCR|nr:hypothetical protein MOQ_000035 [Trypanosoma cruzi marinkellei]